MDSCSEFFDDIETVLMILKQRFVMVKETINVSKDDIVKAQEEENWIKTVKDAIRNNNSLDKESISSNSFQLKGLMREFKQLLVGSDNILYRKIKNKEEKQVVLSN